MILTNYSYTIQPIGRIFGGTTNPYNYFRPAIVRNRCGRDYTLDESCMKDSIPTATNPPYSLSMGDKGSLLSSTNNTNGASNLTITSLSLGKALESQMDGVSNMPTASMSLLIQLAADLLGEAVVDNASLVGSVAMAADLAGQGDIVSSLKILANITATITATSDLSGTFKGLASLEAEITPFTDLSPQTLSAAIWNSLASAYNESGTMGELINNSGAGGNPWAITLSGTYTAADLLRLISSVLAGKTGITDLGGGAATIKFRDLNDTKDSVVASVTGSERTDIALDLSE